MKISKVIVLVILVNAFALAVASQDVQEFYKTTVVNDKISFDEKQDCAIGFSEESVKVFGNVTRTINTYGTCFNAINQSFHQCINGTETYQSYEYLGSQIVLRNTTNCKTKSYLVSVNKNNDIKKYELDFSSWGPCIQETENNCLAITCVSLTDGAHLGKFTNCKGGKSCQKFVICNNKISVLYKNSREDFVEHDPTFYLKKLNLKEVSE